jgi:hypothetical protein
MMKIPQVLHQMIAACKPFVANTIAAGDCTWVVGCPEAVDGRLVALQIGEPREVRGGGATGYFTGPCPVDGGG